jgi:hypothetical protein
LSEQDTLTEQVPPPSGDRCRECGLDLATDPWGDHDEGYHDGGMCWRCREGEPWPPTTPQERAEQYARWGVKDVAVLTRYLRSEFKLDEEHSALRDEEFRVRGEFKEADHHPRLTDEEFRALAERALRERNNPAEALVVRPLEEFAEDDEPAAAAVLGTEDAALIAEGSDTMVYGTGGAGKTTLVFDLGFHLASGRPWIEIPVPRARRVLLIENEGPRPLLRRKLRRKLEVWDGELGDRLRVYEQPWGKFSLTDESWREKLAQKIAADEIDVLIAGPVSRIGMTDAGTLEEVRAFMEQVADVRDRCGRALTVLLVHHENKGGTVSGAWEGSGDTLLHVKEAGNGHTIVHVEKARWDPERHHTTLKLAWAPGEGFRPEGERDLLTEVVMLLLDCKWRTAKQIAAPSKRDENGAEKGGIGAGTDAVKKLLDDHPERFKSCTGEEAKALGRSPKAILWALTQAPRSVKSVTDFSREGGTALTHPPPRRGGGVPESVHLPGLAPTQTAESVPQNRPEDDGREAGRKEVPPK